MPKIWRQICLQLTMLITAITALLICALVLLRPDEITRLAAISGTWRQMGTYFLVTLPYLLPIALPLATMAGCFVIAAQMIRRGEWLALTTAGLSPWQICAPILSLLFVIAGLNALICSESVQTAHLIAERLKLDWAALRPLRALQPREPLRLARMAVSAGGRSGESLLDFALCYARPDKSNRLPSLELIFAKGLNFKSTSFEMLDYRLIHLQRGDQNKSTPDFFVQSGQCARIPIPMLRSLLSQPSHRDIPLNRRSLRNLWQLRAQDPSAAVGVELIRRAASATLPVALGLLGLWTGSIAALGRRKNALIIAALCAILTFLSPHFGKSLAHHWPTALAAYFTMQIAAIAIGLRSLHTLRLG